MALIRGEQLENNIQLTGSLYGTSSYALTASYVANANFNTGSFATTGSNIFSGSQTIRGDLTIQGNLTAQTFIISSSVSYFTESFSSGSTRFGDDLNDTHIFTGSVIVTGSLSVNGSRVITSNQTSSMSVLTSSYAVSASYALNASLLNGTGSTVFATTGSNQFNGNQTITGSLIQGLEGNIATGENSHAEGSITKAIGNYSHAEGDNTQAKGDYSHAEGQETIASGSYSHAEGYQTIALANHQHVQGQYNAVSSVLSAFIIGNGPDDNNRSNLIHAAGNQVEITGSLNVNGGITGSLLGTASYANNSTSSSYAVSASYANIQYVSNSLENALNQIEVLDYDSNTAVTFTDGRLKFIFGTPASPSSVAVSTTGFATDRFNQVTDNYTVNGSWSNGGYTIISASLYEGTTLLTQVSTGTSLTYNTTTSGSHTYQLQYTASSPLDATLYKTAVTTTNTLSKVSPGSPTISPTTVIQLGTTSNQIEQGATGSITFTSASGASNSWVFNYIGTTVPSPLTVTGSATGSSSIAVTATSYYSSSGVNGSDNVPALTTTTTATTTYTKIRSLRYGASVTSSYTAAQLETLSLWDTTLGGSVGTIAKGTTTASGQSVTITWTGDKYHYIAYNSALASLTNITAAGFGVLSAFTLTTIGSYKVYRTNVLQAGGAGTSITYVLT